MRRVVAACTATAVALAPTLVVLSTIVVVSQFVVTRNPARANHTPTHTATPTATPTASPGPRVGGTAEERCAQRPNTEEAGSVSDTTVRPGQTVTIEGGGFERDTELRADFCQPTHLLNGRANNEGRYRFDVTIPTNASAGEHRIIVTGRNRSDGVHRTVTHVTVHGRALPRTGGSATRDVMWAFALLTAGEALIAVELFARRRRVRIRST